VDGSSIALSSTVIPYSPTTAPSGIILPGGTTLLPGSTAVVGGTTYSADPAGALVVSIGTSVTTVTPGKETTISATVAVTTNGGAGMYNWTGAGRGPGSKTAAAVGMHKGGLVHIWAAVGATGAGVWMILL
jgi:hypothetical protein